LPSVRGTGSHSLLVVNATDMCAIEAQIHRMKSRSSMSAVGLRLVQCLRRAGSGRAALWSGAGPPATLTLEPEAATNEVETEHCVTATVQHASGNPAPGVTVRFSVMGSVNTSGSATTDANGQAVFCYDGPEFPGADVIEAFADTKQQHLPGSGRALR